LSLASRLWVVFFVSALGCVDLGVVFPASLGASFPSVRLHLFVHVAAGQARPRRAPGWITPCWVLRRAVRVWRGGQLPFSPSGSFHRCAPHLPLCPHPGGLLAVRASPAAPLPAFPTPFWPAGALSARVRVYRLATALRTATRPPAELHQHSRWVDMTVTVWLCRPYQRHGVGTRLPRSAF